MSTVRAHPCGDFFSSYYRRFSAVAAVVNLSNPTLNISQVDLRKIFAGERRIWQRGIRIKLIVRLPGCRERLTLLKLLGMSESEYKQYWAAQGLSR